MAGDLCAGSVLRLEYRSHLGEDPPWPHGAFWPFVLGVDQRADLVERGLPPAVVAPRIIVVRADLILAAAVTGLLLAQWPAAVVEDALDVLVDHCSLPFRSSEWNSGGGRCLATNMRQRVEGERLIPETYLRLAASQ